MLCLRLTSFLRSQFTPVFSKDSVTTHFCTWAAGSVSFCPWRHRRKTQELEEGDRFRRPLLRSQVQTRVLRPPASQHECVLTGEEAVRVVMAADLRAQLFQHFQNQPHPDPLGRLEPSFGNPPSRSESLLHDVLPLRSWDVTAGMQCPLLVGRSPTSTEPLVWALIISAAFVSSAYRVLGASATLTTTVVSTVPLLPSQFSTMLTTVFIKTFLLSNWSGYNGRFSPDRTRFNLSSELSLLLEHSLMMSVNLNYSFCICFTPK